MTSLRDQALVLFLKELEVLLNFICERIRAIKFEINQSSKVEMPLNVVPFKKREIENLS